MTRTDATPPPSGRAATRSSSRSRSRGCRGPRGNLELIAALAAFADERVLMRWSEMSPTEAPGDQPAVVLVCAGVVGLGRFVLGRPDILALLHERARDPAGGCVRPWPWHFQDAGRADPAVVVDLLGPWVTDPHPLVQRAVVAALCEPALLREPTVAIAGRGGAWTRSRTRSWPARTVVHRTSGCCARRSATAGASPSSAAPVVGTTTFDRWIAIDDPDVRWIVRENIRKARLRSLEAAWLASAQRRAGLPGSSCSPALAALPGSRDA